MTIEIFLGLLTIATYVAVDFIVFKYFIHNKNGLIQILIAKHKRSKKIFS